MLETFALIGAALAAAIAVFIRAGRRIRRRDIDEADASAPKQVTDRFGNPYDESDSRCGRVTRTTAIINEHFEFLGDDYTKAALSAAFVKKCYESIHEEHILYKDIYGRPVLYSVHKIWDDSGARKKEVWAVLNDMDEAKRYFYDGELFDAPRLPYITAATGEAPKARQYADAAARPNGVSNADNSNNHDYQHC
ncbi:MAG: hypothetical protein RR091_03900 [Cloacibacillus sp.]